MATTRIIHDEGGVRFVELNGVQYTPEQLLGLATAIQEAHLDIIELRAALTMARRSWRAAPGSAKPLAAIGWNRSATISGSRWPHTSRDARRCWPRSSG